MGIEKRKSRRTDVNVYISLRQLDDKYVSGYAGDTVDVNVINISKMAWHLSLIISLNLILITIQLLYLPIKNDLQL